MPHRIFLWGSGPLSLPKTDGWLVLGLAIERLFLILLESQSKQVNDTMERHGYLCHLVSPLPLTFGGVSNPSSSCLGAKPTKQLGQEARAGSAVRHGMACLFPVLDMAILGRCINGVFLFNAVSLRFPWFLNSDSRFLASSLLLPHRTMSYATAHPRTGT